MDSQSAVLPAAIGWMLLGLFSVSWVLLGLYWGRKAKDLSGYMVAGRNVGLALGTATAMATWVTSNTIMLAPLFAIQFGIWGMLAYSTAAFGLFLFAPMARRIRHLMPNGFTSGDFIRLRYGMAAWFVFLLIMIFYSLAWLVSMAMAGGIVLNTIAGIPYQYGMTIILLTCVLYTLFGGMYAVIGTDYIQSIIIMIGVVVVGGTVLTLLPLGEVYESVLLEQPALLNVLLPASIMILFNSLLFGFGEVFHNNIWWSRAFAMRKGVGMKAYTMAGLCWLPIPVAAGFLGLASGALGVNLTSPDMVGPAVASQVLGLAGAVIIFIVIFASLASSIDSLLAATSDILTEDLFRRVFYPEASEVTLRKAAGLMVIFLGILAWGLSFRQESGLLEVLFFAGPLVASTIWPIAAGLYWKRVNRLGALLALLLGSAIGLTAYFTIGWYVASLIGAAVSMTIVLVSTWLAPEDFDWKTLNEKPHHQPEAELV